MLNIFKRIFDNEYKELKKFEKLADEIMLLDDKMSKLSDEKLKAYTDKFRKSLS